MAAIGHPNRDNNKPAPMPLVTIIVPIYNAERWIEATLRSILSQTFPPQSTELILVDDASKDSSIEIAERILREHGYPSRFIKKRSNAGAGAARNAGLREAKGDWVQFLDADDILAPDKIRIQVEFAQTMPSDVAVIYSRWRHLRCARERWRPDGPDVRPNVESNPLAQIFSQNFGFVGPTLIRRRFLEAVSGFDETLSLGEDHDLMLRIAMAGGCFREAHAAEPLFLYRATPDSLGRKEGAKLDSINGLVQICRRVELFLREQHSDQLPLEARLALAQRYASVLSFLYEHDRASFHRTLAWTNALDPKFASRCGWKTRALSALLGYENSERVKFALKKALGAPLQGAPAGRTSTLGMHSIQEQRK